MVKVKSVFRRTSLSYRRHMQMIWFNICLDVSLWFKLHYTMKNMHGNDGDTDNIVQFLLFDLANTIYPSLFNVIIHSNVQSLTKMFVLLQYVRVCLFVSLVNLSMSIVLPYFICWIDTDYLEVAPMWVSKKLLNKNLRWHVTVLNVAMKEIYTSSEGLIGILNLVIHVIWNVIYSTRVWWWNVSKRELLYDQECDSIYYFLLTNWLRITEK